MSDTLATIIVDTPDDFTLSEDDVVEIVKLNETSIRASIEAGSTSGILYIRDGLVAVPWKLQTN